MKTKLYLIRMIGVVLAVLFPKVWNYGFRLGKKDVNNISTQKNTYLTFISLPKPFWVLSIPYAAGYLAGFDDSKIFLMIDIVFKREFIAFFGERVGTVPPTAEWRVKRIINDIMNNIEVFSVLFIGSLLGYFFSEDWNLGFREGKEVLIKPNLGRPLWAGYDYFSSGNRLSYLAGYISAVNDSKDDYTAKVSLSETKCVHIKIRRRDGRHIP